MLTTPRIETCDHCSKKVDELWIDNECFHFCPVCWYLYHDYEPNNECHLLTFTPVSTFHKRCHDCGQFIKKELWVRKNHPSKTHALCGNCILNYELPEY